MLFQNEQIICATCRHDMSIVPYTDFKNNKINAIFYGKVPVKKAMSFLFLRKQDKTQQLIHQLKYKGNQEIGTLLGSWFGYRLKEAGVFEKVDYIVPVPLHPKKRKQRGYNQLTTFGIKLSEILEIPYDNTVLIRTATTKTQTFKKRFERFDNQNTKFQNTAVSFFKNKHILLIDDVITTGATLIACCKALLETPKITISIVTMAYTVS